jgi:hypothetical protein
MKVLVACEFSGTVREAFRTLGHDAMSCDLLPTETPGPHHQGDVREILDGPWDLAICHPPCTYLTVSGNKWMKPEFRDRFPDRERQREEAVEFFMLFADCGIPKVAIENPIGIMSTRWRKPDQVIQPWMFGHGEIKATCLWLKGLPKLVPTHMKGDLFAEEEPVERHDRLHRLPPGPERWKERSKTFAGIAKAMAEQWGGRA